MEVKVKSEPQASITKLPQDYHQIYQSYTTKQYEQCLALLENVSSITVGLIGCYN
jgi:hypothetical protein